jgi:hypothetical protein
VQPLLCRDFVPRLQIPFLVNDPTYAKPHIEDRIPFGWVIIIGAAVGVFIALVHFVVGAATSQLTEGVRLGLQMALGLLESLLWTTVRMTVCRQECVRACASSRFWSLKVKVDCAAHATPHEQFGTEVAKNAFGALRPHFLSVCLGVTWPALSATDLTSCTGTVDSSTATPFDGRLLIH